MTEVAHNRGRSAVRPVDLSKLLERLELGIGQAAHLCGVSIRQLSYWTDKGIIQPSDRSGSRTYDYRAIEKVCLIRQALDQGDGHRWLGAHLLPGQDPALAPLRSHFQQGDDAKGSEPIEHDHLVPWSEAQHSAHLVGHVGRQGDAIALEVVG